MRRSIRVLAALGLCLGAVISATADTIQILPVKDNTMWVVANDNPAVQLSSGSGTSMYVGRSNFLSQNPMRRGLIEFSFAGIPVGSTITSVSLTMTMTMTIDLSPRQVDLHRVTLPWGEGSSVSPQGGGAFSQPPDASWFYNLFDGTITGSHWAAPGGDFVGAISASTTIGTAVNQQFTWASTPTLVADVQGFVNNPGTNFGWILTGDEVTNGTVRQLASREHANTAFRPFLDVTFTPAAVPEPGTILLIGSGISGCALAAWQRRQKRLAKEAAADPNE